MFRWETGPVRARAAAVLDPGTLRGRIIAALQLTLFAGAAWGGGGAARACPAPPAAPLQPRARPQSPWEDSGSGEAAGLLPPTPALGLCSLVAECCVFSSHTLGVNGSEPNLTTLASKEQLLRSASEIFPDPQPTYGSACVTDKPTTPPTCFLYELPLSRAPLNLTLCCKRSVLLWREGDCAPAASPLEEPLSCSLGTRPDTGLLLPDSSGGGGLPSQPPRASPHVEPPLQDSRPPRIACLLPLHAVSWQRGAEARTWLQARPWCREGARRPRLALPGCSLGFLQPRCPDVLVAAGTYVTGTWPQAQEQKSPVPAEGTLRGSGMLSASPGRKMAGWLLELS